MSAHTKTSIAAGLRISGLAVGINLLLAVGKIVAGVLGNSYALIADGIESTADIFSSFIVWSGLHIAVKPPDDDHPFGHGKAESLAALVVSLMLLGAAALIAVQSIRKQGLHLAMDIHVKVNGDLSVWRGHEIAHRVKDHLLTSQPCINNVTVHIEPCQLLKTGVLTVGNRDVQ